MAKKVIRGVQQKEELNPKLDRRDVRPIGEKIKETIESGQALAIILFISLASMLMFPQLIEIIGIVSLLFFLWVSKQEISLSFRLPITSRLIDHNDPKEGTNIPRKARGIAFLGNEMDTNRELWFNKSDMCTHILVFGSTGAGKALRNKEKVLTPNGWVNNESLKINDEVITPNGKTSKILEVFPQGKLSLWKIEFDDGRTINVSPNHLWGVSIIHRPSTFNAWDDKNKKQKTEEVLSTENIEQFIFSRTHLNNDEFYAVPLITPTDSAIALWGKTIQTMEKEAYKSLFDNSYYKENKNHYPFPKEWINGTLKQRKNTWKKISKMGKYLGDTLYFDSFNKNALEHIQKLAWSLGYWAKIENNKQYKKEQEKENLFSLIIKLNFKWLAITKITPTQEQEECSCIKIDDPQGLFVTKDWITTHNTETLISMAYNTLVTGSGFIYVDGKGDNSLWAKIFSVVRYLGREDDLLVINFMTGGEDMSEAQRDKASNTLNPFVVGSAAGLTELLVGLMDEAGGDNAMWKGRAISLVSAIMLALVYLRDNDGLLLGVDALREYMLLENIQKLSKRRDLPKHIIRSLKAYLTSLPGYQENAPKQSETVMDQHGYLQMQFTRILGSLADTYGYIFKTKLGEVDFFDVVLNRRILVVLLPAMEKSTDELANLGKIIVACLKQMMATGLGNRLEGNYEDVIEAKPTTSPVPYMCILDEYGYYVVKGASVMPAQARGLGFCMVFAGQDYPAFKKNNNAEEAVSTIGNCNIKIFMKLEDPSDTYELAEKSMGESNVGKTTGLARKPGGAGYFDQQNANIDRRKRVDWLDFKDHREGEAHIIFKSTLVRANMFFADPPKVKKLQLNSLLCVEPPHHSELHEWDEYMGELKTKLMDEEIMEDIIKDTDTPKKIHILQDALKETDKNPMGGLLSICSLFNIIQNTPNNMSQNTRKISIETLANDLEENKDSEEENLHIFRNDLEENKDSEEEDEFDIWAQLQENENESKEDDDDDENSEEETYNTDDEDDDDEDIMLNKDNFVEGMDEIERNLGMSEEEAKQRSETIASDMRVVSTYPKSSPEPIDSDEFTDFIEELDAHLDNDDDE